MITLAEALVVVTAAGLLLGKREISAGAKFFGHGVGRLVGTMQGMRFKYEQKTRGTALYALHRNVKRGLEDMGTIGSDLASIRSGGSIPVPQPPVSIPPHLSRNTGMHVFENTLEIDKLKQYIEAETLNTKKKPSA